jgi:hypothetical protein
LRMQCSARPELLARADGTGRGHHAGGSGSRRGAPLPRPSTSGRHIAARAPITLAHRVGRLGSCLRLGARMWRTDVCNGTNSYSWATGPRSTRRTPGPHRPGGGKGCGRGRREVVPRTIMLEAGPPSVPGAVALRAPVSSRYRRADLEHQPGSGRGSTRGASPTTRVPPHRPKHQPRRSEGRSARPDEGGGIVLLGP